MSKPILASFTVMGPLIWYVNAQVRMWIILDINYKHYYHLGKSQICAGAGDYFRTSKPHSEKLCTGYVWYLLSTRHCLCASVGRPWPTAGGTSSSRGYLDTPPPLPTTDVCTYLDILILDKAYGYFFIDAFPKQLCNEDMYLIMRKQFRIWDYIM